MSERDRLDRMERKLNRIGRFVLLSVALLAVLAATVTEQYYDPYVLGYGWYIASAFAGVVILLALVSVNPFRD
jgi:hypothetical protein